VLPEYEMDISYNRMACEIITKSGGGGERERGRVVAIRRGDKLIKSKHTHSMREESVDHEVRTINDFSGLRIVRGCTRKSPDYVDNEINNNNNNNNNKHSLGSNIKRYGGKTH
jgi:hypothetical protein